MMGASERRDDWPHANWRGGRVVYCGGLENRFGLTADGGSNPSLSATCGVERKSKQYVF